MRETNHAKNKANSTYGGLIYSRMKLLESLNSKEPPATPCDEHPHMCKAPFNCHTAKWSDTIPLAKNGHANVQSWCAPKSARFAPTLVKHCLVEHDLPKSALAVFNQQLITGANELDGSYCFMEGHCTNTEVTDNTTLEEAEKMCDRRYGHAGWTGNYFAIDTIPMEVKAMLDMMAFPHIPGMDKSTGFHEQKITKMFLKLACSMGNYHCDVQYCKHTFCKISHYRKRYQHLLPKVAGHNIKDF